MKPSTLLPLLLAGAAGLALSARAQAPVPPPAPAVDAVPAADLAQWLGPVALYPDPLLAQVLAATTKPADVVLAERYLSSGGDPAQVDQQPWDPSVKALARYPDVLKLMNDYLGWTTELGQAFLDQQPQVMDAIQDLRAQARELGNLQSSPQESILDDNGTIEILPTNPDVIYVPDYEPDVVYAINPPCTSCISFGPPLPMGSWMDRDFDWQHHRFFTWAQPDQRPADWWAARSPAPRTAPTPGPARQPLPLLPNPRTRTTRFIVWQTPHIRVVTPGDLADRGWAPPEGYADDEPERPGGGSSLLIIPYHSSASAGLAPPPAPAIQVYPSDASYVSEDSSGSYYGGGHRFGGESAHDTQRFSHRGRESRGSGSHSTPHQHGSAPSHGGGQSHSGGTPHSGAPTGKH